MLLEYLLIYKAFTQPGMHGLKWGKDNVNEDGDDGYNNSHMF